MMWNASVGRGVILLASTLLLAALARTDLLQSPPKLAVGMSLDLFKRYGLLLLSIRVLPFGNVEPWVFREPTTSVFRDVECFNHGTLQHTDELSVGDIHIEFCDNTTHLAQIYFQNFTIERLEQPWRALAGTWKPDSVALTLGLDSKFMSMNYGYVLVRVSKYRESERILTLPNNIPVEERVYEAIQNITVGDRKSVTDFIEKYGSHYISSYTTGNSIFQVFAFNSSVYSSMKDHVKARGISNIPRAEIQAFFSPLYAKHIGPIKVAGNTDDVANWAKLNLMNNSSNSSSPSILKLYDQLPLLKTLDESLKNEALLQVELKTLSLAFKDVQKKQWFEEVIDNYLKLWETNVS